MHRRFLAAPLAALLVSLVAAAQEKPRSGVYLERLDVNVVNVEVFVTDKKGRPVTDLEAADFAVYEDGTPMTITNFYAVEGGAPDRRATERPVGDERAAAAPAPPAAAPKAARPVPATTPPDQRLHVILYFDNLYLRPFNRNKVMREVRDFVARHVGRDDQVMVASFDKDLHVRQPFTSDRVAIYEALTGMEKVMGFAVAASTSRRDVIRRVESARDRLEAESHVDFFAKSAYNDVSSSLRSLKDLVGSLAGLPGRKVLIHVSDGMPMTAGQDLFELVDELFPGGLSGRMLAARYDAKRQFRELTAKANASRVTFYTISAAGLRSHDSLSAENPGAGGAGRNKASHINVDFARLSNETEPLQLMADETGGLATFNTNNFSGALERVAADLGTYYSLGYQSPSPGDGRYHTIEVEVRGRGLEVRHRRGYRAKTPESLVSDSTYATLLFGVEANPLEVQIEFEGPRSQDDGRVLLPVLVKIPLGRVALLPSGDLRRGTVRVSLAVIDPQGRLSPVEQSLVPIEVPEGDLEAARSQYWVYAAELLMRKGDQTVAVGVRDDLSGESSFIRAPVRIGT